MHAFTDVLVGLLRLMVRLALLAAGAVFFLSMLVAGIVVAGAYTLWSLLQGRRPSLQDILRFQRGRGSWAGSFGTGGSARPSRPTSPDDVVEVQAREITRVVR